MIGATWPLETSIWNILKETWPKHEYQRLKEWIEDVEATIFVETSFEVIWRLMSSKRSPILWPIPKVCSVWGSYTE